MRQTTLPDGTSLPVLGLGTWRLGEDAGTRQDEIRTLHAAIAMGYRLIDTAEMWALAWISSQPGVLAIPKAGTLQHLQQNLSACAVELVASEREVIEARFPRPRRKTLLAMI